MDMEAFWIIAIGVLIFGGVSALYTESDAMSTPSNCTHDIDCMATSQFGICVYVDVMVAGVLKKELRCVCDSDTGHYKNGHQDSCVHHALLGETCEKDSVCVDVNADCQSFKETPDNVQICQCRPGYVHVQGQRCAPVITTLDDFNCSACENNSGQCYDLDGDQLKDGCLCPSYRSGTDCSKSDVQVLCDAEAFSMRLCYEPQFYNVSSPAVLYVLGKDDDEACKGVMLESNLIDLLCTPGHYEIRLPLEDGQRQRCNTQVHMQNLSTRLYTNKVMIAHNGLHADDTIYTASCAFKTQAKSSFNPIGLFVRVEGSHAEKQFQPKLGMFVQNDVGNSVPYGVALRLGDKISFKILLTADGTYSAIRILRCTASTGAVNPHLQAMVVPLVLASCPAPNQNHITDKNNWRPVSGRLNELTTGPLRMFKLPHGRSVHIHCAIKLCLKGSESDCDPVKCTNPYPHLGYGRKKRSDDDPGVLSSTTVSRELVWFDDGLVEQPTNVMTASSNKETKGNGVRFIVTCSVLGGIAMIMLTIVALLFIFLRKRIARFRKRSQLAVRNRLHLFHAPPVSSLDAKLHFVDWKQLSHLKMSPESHTLRA